MKRRGFISGLLAAPLALKARLAKFFVRTPCVERCGAPILGGPVQPARYWSPTARRREIVQLLAEGKSMKEVAGVLKLAPRSVDCHTASNPLLFCSLPLGHKGPHVLLNPR